MPQRFDKVMWSILGFGLVLIEPVPDSRLKIGTETWESSTVGKLQSLSVISALSTSKGLKEFITSGVCPLVAGWLTTTSETLQCPLNRSYLICHYVPSGQIRFCPLDAPLSGIRVREHGTYYLHDTGLIIPLHRSFHAHPLGHFNLQNISHLRSSWSDILSTCHQA